MNEIPLVEALRATLDDQRLSRGERQAVRAMVQRQIRSKQQLDVIRGQAFDLAREQLSDPQSIAVLQWLEDVVKALEPRPSSKRSRREAYFAPNDDCPTRIISLLDDCRKTAEICVFTITDDRVTDAIQAAHERGVDVRIISDNDKAWDPGSDVLRLARRGVPVRIDLTPHHMHHKFALVDREILITGSYNWTRSAAEKNYENLVLLQEQALIDAFFGEFEKIWKNSAPQRPV